MKQLIAILFAGLLLFGCTQTQTQSPAVQDTVQKKLMASTTPNSMQDKAMENKTVILPTTGPSDEVMVLSSSTGGGTYEAFSESRYDAAKKEGKIIFLEFYASWCPICKEQEPQIEAAFQQGVSSRVAGFRVHYRDDQTGPQEEDLARQFGIAYQHTHVILDTSGNLAAKSPEVWSSDQVRSEIQKIVNR